MDAKQVNTLFRANQNVIYNDTEYEINGIGVFRNKEKNSFYTLVLLKDIKANSVVSVEPERIERVKEE